MIQQDEVRAYLDIVGHVKRRLVVDDAVRRAHFDMMTEQLKSLLKEMSKSPDFDALEVAVLRKELDSLCKEEKPVEPLPAIEPAIPVQSESEFLNEIRQRRRAVDPVDAEVTEDEILQIADDMREAALNVHSYIKRDNQVLSMTAKLQDDNLMNTSAQNKSARAIRSSKRLSFIMTIIMVISSAIIFLVLVPLIIVT
jgi:hypothetical protein